MNNYLWPQDVNSNPDAEMGSVNTPSEDYHAAGSSDVRSGSEQETQTNNTALHALGVIEQKSMPSSLSLPPPPSLPPIKRKHRWTRAHSYFALMGGYAFDPAGYADTTFTSDRSRKTLTSQALRIVAQVAPGTIPDPYKEWILDKSKASELVKALASLQAIWFICQVVGRLATGNPISLLELNFALHALCCLLIYMAW
jgi:hypothetical protein